MLSLGGAPVGSLPGERHAQHTLRRCALVQFRWTIVVANPRTKGTLCRLQPFADCGMFLEQFLFETHILSPESPTD